MVEGFCDRYIHLILPFFEVSFFCCLYGEFLTFCGFLIWRHCEVKGHVEIESWQIVLEILHWSWWIDGRLYWRYQPDISKGKSSDQGLYGFHFTEVEPFQPLIWRLSLRYIRLVSPIQSLLQDRHSLQYNLPRFNLRRSPIESIIQL
jgi:hypothetical protein